MRRGFSILLILVFGLGPLSATLQATDDHTLPACCRRNGAHHCSMAGQMAAMAPANPQAAFTVPHSCPDYPGARPVLITSIHAVMVAAVSMPGLMVRPWVPAAGPTLALSSPSRKHAGRGPPTYLPS